MPSAAILKCRKIAIGRGLTDFDEIWHSDSSTLLTSLTVKNLKFQKSKMVAAAILKNRKIDFPAFFPHTGLTSRSITVHWIKLAFRHLFFQRMLNVCYRNVFATRSGIALCQPFIPHSCFTRL